MNAVIYEIRNIENNKVYIGSSSKPRQRKNNHFCELRKNRHRNPKLQNAVNKYGIDKFIFTIILAVNIESQNQLLELEERFIQSRNSRVNGYNIGLATGNPQAMMTLEQKLASYKKISAALTGKKLSNQHKQSISTALQGRTKADSTRAKISAAKKGVAFTKVHRSNLSKARTKPFFIDGVLFDSFKGGQAFAQLTPGQLKYRLNSKNFPNYFYVG